MMRKKGSSCKICSEGRRRIVEAGSQSVEDVDGGDILTAAAAAVVVVVPGEVLQLRYKR